MISPVRYVHARIVRPLRWLAAVLILAFLTLAAAGPSARISGEVSAALQAPGTRAVALALMAVPLVTALRAGHPRNEA